MRKLAGLLLIMVVMSLAGTALAESGTIGLQAVSVCRRCR